MPLLKNCFAQIDAAVGVDANDWRPKAGRAGKKDKIK